MPGSVAHWTTLQIQSVIAGVDAVAHEMELRWGVGRLRLLVGDDLRARFDRQMVWWSRAVFPPDGSEAQLPEVERIAAATKRAWQALDHVATEAQQKPLDPEVWEVGLPDGRVLAVTRTNAEALRVAQDDRAKVVWTLEEVARLVDKVELVNVVKREFPGARVTSISDPTYGCQDDPIPFDDDISDLKGAA